MEKKNRLIKKRPLLPKKKRQQHKNERSTRDKIKEERDQLYQVIKKVDANNSELGEGTSSPANSVLEKSKPKGFLELGEKGVKKKTACRVHIDNFKKNPCKSKSILLIQENISSPKSNRVIRKPGKSLSGVTSQSRKRRKSEAKDPKYHNSSKTVLPLSSHLKLIYSKSMKYLTNIKNVELQKLEVDRNNKPASSLRSKRNVSLPTKETVGPLHVNVNNLIPLLNKYRKKKGSSEGPKNLSMTGNVQNKESISKYSRSPTNVFSINPTNILSVHPKYLERKHANVFKMSPEVEKTSRYCIQCYRSIVGELAELQIGRNEVHVKKKSSSTPQGNSSQLQEVIKKGLKEGIKKPVDPKNEKIPVDKVKIRNIIKQNNKENRESSDVKNNSHLHKSIKASTSNKRSPRKLPDQAETAIINDIKTFRMQTFKSNLNAKNECTKTNCKTKSAAENNTSPIIFDACNSRNKTEINCKMCKECPMRQLISKIDPVVGNDKLSYPVIAFTCCRRSPRLKDTATSMAEV